MAAPTVPAMTLEQAREFMRAHEAQRRLDYLGAVAAVAYGRLVQRLQIAFPADNAEWVDGRELHAVASLAPGLLDEFTVHGE